MERTFDRRVNFDERSRNYPVSAVLPACTPRSYTWSNATVTDQGQEGACVGHAVSGELASRPVPVPGVTNEYAYTLYKEAQKIDEWPGEDYSGSSVLAGMKVATARGFYKEYRWAFSVEDLAVAVSRMGPAVLGLKWHTSMYKTEKRPNITYPWLTVTDEVAGGHAIQCVGFSLRYDAFLLQNSWGRAWGYNGRAWISKSDLTALLADQGEACIPTGRSYG